MPSNEPPGQKQSRGAAESGNAPTSEVRFVSQDALRRLYRESGYEQMVSDGVLSESVRKSAFGPPHQEPGTLSQFVEYRDPKTGQLLVQVHRYLKPDGTLGASGRPDPKTVRVGSTVYKAH